MELNLIESFQKDSSAKVLILSNAITIVLAVAFNWNFFVILWTFWIQSVLIGIFNFFRIITLKNFSVEGFRISGFQTNKTAFTKIFAAFFFAFHYGFFHLIYAVFLGVFTFASKSLSFSDVFFIFFAGLIFFFNHLFSFFYFKNKEKTWRLKTIFFFPYARIIPMHLIIIFGGPFLALGMASVPLLVGFLLLKTGADVIMHFIEHREQL
jgi:hypothetical protein